ncbi:hypothetical protein F53441_6262 [Fusarium austroafricanum]|uniref:RRM domain-containing protein n=1 Tax=Fusarium austroafricanum TaxID=2364996 RepID=A0A8H4NZQ1_9HYPO|nr:hypothetical protein F53441_6262 [Fusarium austroafricanum]
MSTRRDPRAYANMSSPAEAALMDSFQGTPETRLTMFSPGESSYGMPGMPSYGSNNAAAPSTVTQPSRAIYNDGVVTTYDKDPFVDSRTGKSSRLSPTASAFQPAASQSKGKTPVVFHPEGSPTVASELSHLMDVSHRIEVCDTPAPSITELGNFIVELNRKGARLYGGRNLETTGSRIYIVFEDLRDAAWAVKAIRKYKETWLSVYVKTKPERADHGLVRFSELRQLDIEVNVLNYAILDPAHVDEIVQRSLNAYGQLFTMVRRVSFPNGAFRGVVQFCKAADALTAYKALHPNITTDGVVITLKKPEDVGSALPDAQLVNGLENMSVSATPRTGSMFAMNHAPQGNPWASPAAFQLPTGPSQQYGGYNNGAQYGSQQYGQYNNGGQIGYNMYSNGNGGYNMTANTALVPRDTGFGLGPFNGFGRFDPRRNGGRYGRGGSRGVNNVVDLNELIAGRDVRTTIMLRNIPNKVDQPLLKRIVDASSFGKYDFMYLRIDFANDCNVGYAFINFVKAEYIIDFFQARANKRWNCFKSDKVAEISYATIQGKDCLVQKFRNSSVMLEAEHYRPKLFHTIHGDDPTVVGQEEEFPGPDNQSKMKRSVENAEHVGLFTPTAGQYFRDEQRRRHSQYDRGTRLAALEEISYGSSLVPYYGSYGRNYRQ